MRDLDADVHELVICIVRDFLFIGLKYFVEGIVMTE